MFIVRAWPINPALTPPAPEPFANLGDALDAARDMAADRRWLLVQVTDAHAMIWAQFNMLWSVNGH